MGAIKAIKQAGHMLSGYSAAGVCDRDFAPLAPVTIEIRIVPPEGV
jgi:hypothetical protein